MNSVIEPLRTQTTTINRRLLVLDGVRGTAILMVMAFHFFQGRPAPLGLMAKILAKVAHQGQTGVDLFFVLSGFLITGILLDSKNNPHGLRNFYIRRTLRIFPLYYGVLFLLFVVWPFLNNAPLTPWRTQWWYWTYSQDIGFAFLKNHIAGPAHFWSLAVEEHFYLLWPFLVLRYDSRRLLVILAAIIGASVPIRAFMAWAGFDVFFFTFSRMDGLAAGAVLAVLYRNSSEWAALVAWLRRLMPIYIPILALLQIGFARSGYISFQAIKYTSIACLYFGLLALLLSAKETHWVKRLLCTESLATVGRYSYSMYVFHPFIFDWFNGKMPSLSLLPAFLAECTVTFLVAWCSWVLWEYPFLKLKRNFPTAS